MAAGSGRVGMAVAAVLSVWALALPPEGLATAVVSASDPAESEPVTAEPVSEPDRELAPAPGDPSSETDEAPTTAAETTPETTPAETTPAETTTAAAPVEVATASLPQGQTRHAYAATLQATGGAPPYAWTSEDPPPGLSVSQNGKITGTPTAAGTYDLTVGVTDADGATDSRTLELKVVLPTPKITTTGLPAGSFRHRYAATLRATDGTPGYTWSRSAGALPTGLTLTRGGRIAGTPTRVGTWSFTVKVTDSKGKYATRALRITTSARMDAVVSKVSASYLRYSYRPGCPIGPSGLRRIALNQWGFTGQPYRGELIVRSTVVPHISRVFGKSFAAKFPVRKMRRVEAYKGSDEKSMADDNTSAFNCRHVTGNPTRLSQHSYGNAVDINTFENPYVTASRVYPPGARAYLKRSPYRTGMILPGGVFAKAFSTERWYWGARWRHPDYQHFSQNGR